jgi:hypothetical protein
VALAGSWCGVNLQDGPERLKRIGILAPRVPGENSSLRHGLSFMHQCTRSMAWLFHREQFFDVLDGTRRSAVVAYVGSNSVFAVHLPQVADRCHLDAVTGLQLGNNQTKIVTSASDADIAERNAIVRANNVFVRIRPSGMEDAVCRKTVVRSTQQNYPKSLDGSLVGFSASSEIVNACALVIEVSDSSSIGPPFEIESLRASASATVTIASAMETVAGQNVAGPRLKSRLVDSDA